MREKREGYILNDREYELMQKYCGKEPRVIDSEDRDEVHRLAQLGFLDIGLGIRRNIKDKVD